VSGHLRWLAAQALGQSSGVRPARRPPLFVGPPATPEAPGERVAPDMPAELHHRADVQMTARPGEDVPIRRAADPEPAEHRVEQRRDSVVLGTPRESAVTEGSRTRPAERAFPEAPVHAAEDGERVVSEDRPRGGGVVGETISQPFREPTARRTSPTAPRATIRPGRRNPAERQADPIPGAAPPAPDVHIHIGRVELTAIAPPAPVRRESASGRKPMSLDEYLRRRGGRGP
jgi:hypothetical protein